MINHRQQSWVVKSWNCYWFHPVANKGQDLIQWLTESPSKNHLFAIDFIKYFHIHNWVILWIIFTQHLQSFFCYLSHAAVCWPNWWEKITNFSIICFSFRFFNPWISFLPSINSHSWNASQQAAFVHNWLHFKSD